MQINKAIALIKRFEGLKLNSYYDSVGVLTIGYGHTKNVVVGQKITELQAEELLKQDLVFVTKKLDLILKNYGYNLTENQYNAIVSFCFNCGFPAKFIDRFKHKKPIDDIIKSMLLYNLADGKKLKGLENRRNAEVSLALE